MDLSNSNNNSIHMSIPDIKIVARNASFFKRILALLVDFFIINVVIISPFRGLFEKFGNGNVTSFLDVSNVYIPTNLVFVMVFIAFLAYLYMSLFQFYLNATPGMMLFKIVINRKLTIWESLFRNLYILPTFPFTILWIVEPIYLLFKKQRLLDSFTNINIIEFKTIEYR